MRLAVFILMLFVLPSLAFAQAAAGDDAPSDIEAAVGAVSGSVAEDAVENASESGVLGNMRNAFDGGAEYLRCPSCPVTENFLRGALTLTLHLAEKVSDSASNLAGVILGVWLMVKAAQTLMPFGPIDRTTQMLNTLFGRFGLAVLIFMAMRAPQLIQEYMLYPLASSTTEVSLLVFQAASTIDTNASPEDCEATVISDSVSVEDAIVNNVTCQSKFAQRTLLEGLWLGLKGMTKDLANNFESTANQIEQQGGVGFFQRARDVLSGSKDFLINFGERSQESMEQKQENDKRTLESLLGIFTGENNVGDYGKSTLTSLWQHSMLGNILTNAVDVAQAAGMNWGKFANMILRALAFLALVLIAGILIAAYPIMMIDAVLKWAFIVLFSPILLPAFIFPGTRPAAFAGFKALAHGALTMVMLAAIMGVGIATLDQIFKTLEGDTFEVRAGGILQTNEYWVILISMLLMWKLMKLAPQFASRFVDAGFNTDTNQAVWGTVTQLFWTAVTVATFGKGKFVQAAVQLSKTAQQAVNK